uniref:Protein farnesyltransferase subunit beta n=1 Tax=Ascaris lumbricoides TaxID=6252 RepID=A0A0M3IP57_ASCLU
MVASFLSIVKVVDDVIAGKIMKDENEVYSFTAFNDECAFSDDGFFIYSSTEQRRVEDLVSEKYKNYLLDSVDDVDEGASFAPVLCRTVHTHYICHSLKELGKFSQSLDASRPWFCYWGMHSLRLLEATVDESLTSSIIRFLKTCEWPTGGYGGGPGQYPHLATTYGAVMALVSIGTEEALASINRKTLHDFIMSVKEPDGSFHVHVGGEIDIRGSYCALAVASITNILDEQIAVNTDSFVISCQTYEGGFGGLRSCEAHGGYTFCGVASLMILGKSALMHTPSLFKWLAQKQMNCQTYEGGFGGLRSCEAHGGYTFCGVASLMILGKSALMHTPSLFKWLAQKQMKFEGGFQGRTNKLVDGCYSFWQAAVFPMMQVELDKRSPTELRAPFDAKALQEFILVICQDKEKGGFRDKPEKARDMYHTCYTLSGLSIAQSYTPDNVVGGSNNRLAHISPVYNICKSYEQKAREYFSKLDKAHISPVYNICKSYEQKAREYFSKLEKV